MTQTEFDYLMTIDWWLSKAAMFQHRAIELTPHGMDDDPEPANRALRNASFAYSQAARWYLT